MTDKQKLDEILKLTHELDGLIAHLTPRSREIVKEIRTLAK